MKAKKYLISNVSIAFLVVFVCVALSRTAFFWNLDFFYLDLLFRIRNVAHVESPAAKIVIVEITDNDIFEFGRWPWPRSKAAEMCDLLKSLGPRQIYLDFLFAGPTTPEEDGQLAQAIEKAGNIYLPVKLPRDGNGVEVVPHRTSQFVKFAKGSGVAALYPDLDGKWRRLPLFFNVDGKTLDNVVLRMIKDDLGMTVKKITPNALVLSDDQREFAIPLVSGNQMILNWRGKWNETFRKYSFSDVYHTVRGDRPTGLSKADLEYFKGSLCLVAIAGAGWPDTKATPLEPSYPGIGVIATALDNIYSGSFLKVVSPWVNVLLFYLFALVPPLYFASELAIREILFFLFIAVAVIAGELTFLSGWVMNFALPFIAFAGSFGLISLYNSARMRIEQAALMALATRDELTGLYNFRYLKEILAEECAVAAKDPTRQFCVLLCDVDHFKGINDKYGHQAGDRVIWAVSNALKSSVRGEDVLARYGGDETAILLRHISSEDACRVAEKMRKAVESLTFSHEGTDYRVTVSLGVAPFKSGDDQTSIIKKADLGLYAAKQGGRNKVFLHKVG